MATSIGNVGYASTNYYVLGQSTTRLLVDVGWPGTLPMLRANLKRKDIPLEHIGFLLATHYHPDHAGLTQELKALGIKLLVMDVQEAAIPLLKTHMKPSNNYEDITLHDNLRVRLAESRRFLAGIGLDGEIVHSPGHSDDSVTRVLAEGAAFPGDLTARGRATEAARETVLRSWEAIRALGASQVYPGHGPARRL